MEEEERRGRGAERGARYIGADRRGRGAKWADERWWVVRKQKLKWSVEETGRQQRRKNPQALAPGAPKIGALKQPFTRDSSSALPIQRRREIIPPKLPGL